MPRVNHVAKARKPNSVVSAEDIARANNPKEEGDAEAASYYWWKHKVARGGILRQSKTRPRPSQLTLSTYYGGTLSAQEAFEDASPETFEDMVSAIEQLSSDLREVGGQCQGSFDNMPEGLQMGETGQLLEERAQGVEACCDELDSIEPPDPSEFEADEDADDTTEDQLHDWTMEQIDELTSQVDDACANLP